MLFDFCSYLILDTVLKGKEFGGAQIKKKFLRQGTEIKYQLYIILIDCIYMSYSRIKKSVIGYSNYCIESWF